MNTGRDRTQKSCLPTSRKDEIGLSSLAVLKIRWMWHLGTCFHGGIASVGLIVGFNDLRGLIVSYVIVSCKNLKKGLNAPQRVIKASLIPQVSIAIALTFSFLTLAKVLINCWSGRMVLVLTSSGWNSQRPELGKKWLTVFQTNKCWEQETQIQRGSFHIKDHWRYVFKIQMSHSLGPLQKSAGILTLFHTLKYWKLPMQVKLNTSNLHCRWGRWKACLRRKSFNWLAKLPDLNTCLQRFYA